MNKLQILLPTPMYKQLKLIAKNLDYSVAELLRKGAEQIVMFYPQHNADKQIKKVWKYPKANKLGLKVSDPELLKAIANERSGQEGI